jgi:hypothetical protein
VRPPLSEADLNKARRDQAGRANLEIRPEGMLRNGLASPLGTSIPTAPPSPGAPGHVIILLAVWIPRVPGIAGDVMGERVLRRFGLRQ